MEPSIGRSIRQGWSTAARSWPAIGLFAVLWMAVGFMTMLGVAVTEPPDEILAPITEETTAPVAPAPAPAAATEAPSDPLSPEAVPSDSAPPAARELERRMELLGEWFGRAWPVLLACALLFVAGNVWLFGGQIGYLARRRQDAAVKLSELWKAGTRSFLPLAGGWLLSLAGVAALVVGGVLIGLLFSLLPAAVPDGLIAAVAVLLVLAALAGVLWLMVRLAFWFIAIVVDRIGPIAGLRASLRASRGRWWPVAGLGALVVAISFGASLPFALVEWLSKALGGVAGQIVLLISNVAGFVVSLFVGFVGLAAFLGFYEDAKADPGAPSK